MSCTCDYSYTCPPCQQRIELENRIDYQNEVSEWVKDAIIEIAKKLDIVLPDPPKERGRY